MYESEIRTLRTRVLRPTTSQESNETTMSTMMGARRETSRGCLPWSDHISGRDDSQVSHSSEKVVCQLANISKIPLTEISPTFPPSYSFEIELLAIFIHYVFVMMKWRNVMMKPTSFTFYALLKSFVLKHYPWNVRGLSSFGWGKIKPYFK